MTSVSSGKSTIIRTERGLTIAGTRITLYQLMDYICAGYPPKLIHNQFYITDEQFNAAMSYIETILRTVFKEEGDRVHLTFANMSKNG